MSDEVKIEDMTKLKKYLLHPDGFDLKPKLPKLILSITGGAKHFTTDDVTKRKFKIGLMKIAKASNAWIISGGN